MNPAAALVIIALAVSGTVALMLLVRRGSPAGGFFTDSDRAAGVFGVLGTGFAVLLAVVIFLAFESYDRARDQASREAVAISQLYLTAKVFAPEARRELHGELICYARAVVGDEWRRMRDEQQSPLVDDWLGEMERTLTGVRLDSEHRRVAFAHWFDDMVVSGILVVRFLDQPYEGASGSIKPVAMSSTLERMEAEHGAPPGETGIPCDDNGVAS